MKPEGADIRMLDILQLDPTRRMLDIRRIRDSPVPGASASACFPGGRQSVPFCSSVHADNAGALSQLAKGALGALLDADPSLRSGEGGNIAFELIRRRNGAFRRPDQDVTLSLLTRNSAITIPTHLDILAFQPERRTICFLREGVHLRFLEQGRERLTFQDATSDGATLALALQDAAMALLGLVAMPILQDPLPTALEGWKCFRLLAPSMRPAPPSAVVFQPDAPMKTDPGAPSTGRRLPRRGR